MQRERSSLHTPIPEEVQVQVLWQTIPTERQQRQTREEPLMQGHQGLEA